MASHLQTNGSTGSTGTLSVALSSVAVGSLLVANVDFYPAGCTHDVSDSAGNAWHQVVGPVSEGATPTTDSSQWWAIVASGKGGNLTITLSASGSSYCTGFVSEFSAGTGKQWKSAPFDRPASGSGGWAGFPDSASTSASSARSQADEVLVGSYFDEGSTVGAITAGANLSWAVPTNGSQPNGQVGTRGAIEYVVVSSSGTEAATVGGAAAYWVMLLGTYMHEDAAVGGLTFTASDSAAAAGDSLGGFRTMAGALSDNLNA